MMKKTTVVNIRKSPFDVYIGRKGKGQDGYFGNPFWEYSRETNVQLFKRYFEERVQNDYEYYFRVRQLKGKVLGCFCKPQNCHGDIIAEFVNKLDYNPLKLCIICGSDFKDYDYMKYILQWFDIKKIITNCVASKTLIQRFCLDNNILCTEHFPKWDVHGKSASIHQNEEISKESDELLIFGKNINQYDEKLVLHFTKNNKPIYYLEGTVKV